MVKSIKLNYIILTLLFLLVIERGKHPLLVHNNIKNKMLHILVAMVRDRVKYNPDNVYGTSNEVSLAPQVLNI